MAKPTAADRFVHIINAIEMIETRTGDIDLAAFKADPFLQLGIERALEIISEASRHIPEELKTLHSSVPWRRVADIGNRIRHSYHAIDAEIVWEIAKVELQVLKTVIRVIQSSDGH